MKIFQKTVTISAKKRGFHLITKEIERELPEIREIKKGLANLFLQHTSASLTINENYDPSVRFDMENYFNHIVPENTPYFTHTLEGSDDMPAHIKSSMIGVSLTIPISNGKFNLGTWQGIYLNEHRDWAGDRKIVVTLMGE
ncbi:MAG: YjbQ family protein [Epsilonproteobacteria bacterium]|nr:YjbQ family protein [Campylobacterota bacterium]